MPKRNIFVLLVMIAVAAVSWLLRDRVGLGSRFSEVLGRIEGSYLEPVDREQLFAAAMEGVFSRLDEHSAFVAGERRDRLESLLDGEFGGVGLELAASGPDREITVQSPVHGAPAWHAGIAAGDVIRAIDGGSTRRMPLEEATRRLRGRPGTPVTLSIVRGPAAGGEGSARDMVLIREIVQVESVLGDRRRPDGTWEWEIEGEPGVALVRITGFGERTAAELGRALADIEKRAEVAAGSGQPGCLGLVLDLRGNTGGLLSSAVEVCDLFLEEGVIVSTSGRADRAGVAAAEAAGTAGRDVRRATRGSVGATAPLAGGATVPLAVLVDGLTASAAEVVAACLQDHGRARVVGSRSFGKGTVQTVIPLSDGSGLVKLTTAEYLRPSLANIHRRGDDDASDIWGVSPDRGCEITPTGRQMEALASWRRGRDVVPPKNAPVAEAAEPVSYALVPRQVDPVLAAAIDVIGRRP
jgi:carboxyl-terminal processing protease